MVPSVAIDAFSPFLIASTAGISTLSLASFRAVLKNGPWQMCKLASGGWSFVY